MRNMKIKKPQPFTFEAGNRAVLLLHGFTGHTADVRMLGRFLEKKGYTSHAPIYRGHGGTAEDIVEATAEEWWEDVQQAYQHLIDLGYEEIAVAGLSLGGVLGLKLSYCAKIKGVIPMCAPMYFDNEAQLTKGFKQYAKQYKQLEGKDAKTIEEEIEHVLTGAKEVFQELGSFVTEVSKEVESIYAPGFVVQAGQDQMINPSSADYIFEHLQNDHKKLKWYNDAGHVITLSEQRDELHEDIYHFLESLDWND